MPKVHGASGGGTGATTPAPTAPRPKAVSYTHLDVYKRQVLDECGRFAVPILSGHLGGANDLARALAAVCGAVPVITTATDANGVFAVDEWAKHQNCTVLEAERIKHVSLSLIHISSSVLLPRLPGTP